MPAPDYLVTVGDRGASTPSPDDVGALFAVGVTETGPVGESVDCRSFAAVKDAFGDIISTSHFIRSAEAYFRDGGTRFVGSRAVGPAPVNATLALAGAGGTALTLTAVSPGAWANKLAVTITTPGGSDRLVTLSHDDDGVISTGTYASLAAARTALEATGLVTGALGVGTWPLTNLAETNLAGGNDDASSITQTQWDAALDVFEDEQGAGSLAAPGITTSAMHDSLLTKAGIGTNTGVRFALLDQVDTATVSTHTAEGERIKALVTNIGRNGQLLAAWEYVPTVGTGIIAIPPSGPYAGRMARADRENTAGPAQPAANSFGRSVFSVGVTQTWTKDERDVLSDAGVTVVRERRGAVTVSDTITIVDQDEWPQYGEVGGMRVLMAIKAQASEILDQYVSALNNQDSVGAAKKDIVGEAMRWLQRGALIEDENSAAFFVDVQLRTESPRGLDGELLLRTTDSIRLAALHITKVASSDTI